MSALTSCIMPTANRAAFVPRAIEYFLRQDYADRELVIVDDGTEAVEHLVPADPRIRYVRTAAGMSLGAKRNFACEQAHGDIIAHWDDDDWHAPRRLSVQVSALLEHDAEVCGIDHLLFYQPDAKRAWEYRYPRNHRRWLSGSTLVYRRRFWAANRFANVNVGEDARFVWNGPSHAMHVLDDHTFHVGMVHERNTSRKQTSGRWWREVPTDTIRSLLGDDAATFGISPAVAAETALAGASPIVIAGERATPTPVRNVFACLVHEAPDCIVDLVRNLRNLDPSSEVLLYNGSANRELLANRSLFERLGATVVPDARPMQWGKLHDFALDCMRFANRSTTFDTLTIVDSDQLALRAGYSARIGEYLSTRPKVGLLVNHPELQPPNTRVAPARTAWREVDLWRPFLRRFPDGEANWVHWSFWPSTVFTADACRSLTDLFDRDAQLQQIVAASSLWATEEVLFPTLTALLGHEVAANPCSYDFVRYRATYSRSQLDTALRRSDAFWMHPVPRQRDNALRRHVRDHFHQYQPRRTVTPTTAPSDLMLTLPLLVEMKKIEGWLEADEADLLIAATRSACAVGTAPGAIVEVGSYCGRATVVVAKTARSCTPDARVYSIDPHDGHVGARDAGLQSVPPSRDSLRRNLTAAGVADMVELVQTDSWQVEWNAPIRFLLVDGLHDYESVARDFRQFEPHLLPDACVAFHDYADYFPGVRAFVDQLIETGGYGAIGLVRTMIVLRRAAAAVDEA